MDLQLPPEIEDRLRQQAAAAGMDAEQFAIAALQKELAGNGEAAATSSMLPRDAWKAKFDALRRSFPTRQSEGRVDCSRESLYGDRGR